MHEVVNLFTHDAVDERVCQLSEKIDHMTVSITEIIASARTLKQEINQVQLWTSLTVIASELHVLVTDLTQGFLHLTTAHRLSASLLPLPFLQSFWRQLSKHAADKGHPLLLPPHAAYELPASYALANDVSNIVLHIPVLHSKLTLYNFIDFPVARPGLTPVRFQPVTTHIAIDDQRTSYFLPSHSDLHACLSLNDVLLCPFPYLRHDMDNTCLSTLFSSRWQSATRLCPFTTDIPEWLFAVGRGRERHLYAQNKLAYSIHCTNGSTWNGVWEKGFHSFNLDTGCRLITNPFSVAAPWEYSMTTGSIVKPFVWENMSVGMIENVKEEQTSLDKAEEEVQKSEQVQMSGLHLSLWSIVGIASLIIVLVLVLLYLLYRLYVAAAVPE